MTSDTDSNTPKTSPFALISVLVLAVCLTQFASAIYSPSIPAISAFFDVSIDLVQWSMSIYMIGVCCSQLFFGPISEGVGRKKPLSVSLLIMCVGSFVCLISTDIWMLLLGRLIQGVGAGGAACLWRPVFRDVFSHDELAKYGSYLVSIVTLIIPLAPLLGGYLQDYFGWYASFVFMMGYAVVAVAGIFFFFTETHTSYHKSKLRPAHIVDQYLTMFKSRLFVFITFSSFLTYGALYAWFVIGPVLIIKNLNMTSVDFGWLTFAAAMTCSLSAQINARQVGKKGVRFMLRLGWGLSTGAGALMLLLYYIVGLNIWALMIPAFIFFFAAPFIWPNAFATAFTPFGHMAGYAGALYGFMQIGGGAASSGLIAWLPDPDQFSYGFIMFTTCGLAWILYEIGVVPLEKKKVKRAEPQV